jgi:hypothetical protein
VDNDVWYAIRIKKYELNWIKFMAAKRRRKHRTEQNKGAAFFVIFGKLLMSNGLKRWVGSDFSGDSIDSFYPQMGRSSC